MYLFNMYLFESLDLFIRLFIYVVYLIVYLTNHSDINWLLSNKYSDINICVFRFYFLPSMMFRLLANFKLVRIINK